MPNTVATFYSVLEAQIFQAFLKSRLIESFLADEHIISINPLYAAAVGGIKVNVHQKDMPAALVLYEVFKNGESEAVAADVCPRCHSENIMMLPETKNTYYNEFRCFDCDHTWNDRHIHNINPGYIE